VTTSAKRSAVGRLELAVRFAGSDEAYKPPLLSHGGRPRGTDRRKSPRKRYTPVVRKDATRSCETRNPNARTPDKLGFPSLGD
jgi:hypothetical protein